MAIFGTIDAKALATDVSVTNGDATVTTTGDFTNRATADFIQNGDILSLSGVQYTVLSVTSATTLELATAYAGSTGTVSAANAIRRTAPKEVANLLLNENGQLAHFPPGTSLLFIDDAEAALEENKIRGLKFPGWWAYRTFTDGDGNTRHKAECLAFANQTAANAGDYDSDNPAADVASSVSISAQPASSTSVSGAGTFAVTTTTTGTPGTLSYQWQRQTATATTRWVDITANLDAGITYADFTTATLAYSGLADDTLDGYKYRVKITSAGGTEEIISNGAATLTFGD